jgi:hypothetical protein
MRSALERAATPAAAFAVCFCALFFSGATQLAPLVWIGTAALVLAAVAAAGAAFRLLPQRRLDGATVGFLACLAGLAVWMGASIVWSAQPAESWRYTNRTVSYFAFACLGVLAGGLLRGAARRIAAALAVLLALVFGWALLTKAVPSLYGDYGRVARLRAPVGYWNELALLADVAVPLALWLAAGKRRALLRAAGATLLYAVTVGLLLTYSRYGIALAVLVAVLWLALERDRIAGLVAAVLAAAPAAGVFLYALSLPGITDDGQSHAQRVHDGWRFALVTVAVGLLVFSAGVGLARAAERRPLSDALTRRVERIALLAGAAGLVVLVALAAVFARRIWHDFSGGGQVTNASQHLRSLSSSNRWSWWQQAWHAFTGHPGGGTGAGTFALTNRLHRTSSFDVTVEPHNVPLQMLSETGVVGFLLYAGMVVSLAVAVVRARLRSGDAAVTAVGLGLGAWVLHMVGDMDWDYVAVSGPLLLVAGMLLAGEGAGSAASAGSAVRRRPLLAVGGVALALAAVYSLAGPWLAERRLDAAAVAFTAGRPLDAVSDAKKAHSYDPLSTDVLDEWAGYVDAVGETARAERLYLDAVEREPLNPETWYELGLFEFFHERWPKAYRALDRSWGLDRHGPLAARCSYLDVARLRVGITYGVKCRGVGRPARS